LQYNLATTKVFQLAAKSLISLTSRQKSREETAFGVEPGRSALKSARAWRLKMALREVYAQARSHNSQAQAATDLRAWLSWARRCRLEPFKKLATTLKERFDAVVSGMVDHRSNAFVEAMNGLLQQAKRAARGFRTSANFIAIAYLRMSKLKHLPANPFAPSAAK
jgi:transposase